MRLGFLSRFPRFNIRRCQSTKVEEVYSATRSLRLTVIQASQETNRYTYFFTLIYLPLIRSFPFEVIWDFTVIWPNEPVALSSTRLLSFSPTPKLGFQNQPVNWPSVYQASGPFA